MICGEFFLISVLNARHLQGLQVAVLVSSIDIRLLKWTSDAMVYDVIIWFFVGGIYDIIAF